MAIPAFLCLGSNSGNAPEMLGLAASRIHKLPACRVVASSSIYLTEPQDLAGQPWFHNQVLKLLVEREESPPSLMRQFLAIEADLGRKRPAPRFGPRPIDIDLLLLGSVISNDPICILPHPRLTKRAFALVPLLEIAPEATVSGQPAACWLKRLVWHREGNKIFQ